jgi:amidophosphoribosyltransferase
MGGYFGIVSREDCIDDVFFGTDYHSHLGARRGGLAAYDPAIGLQREIHNIENAPFRTKFEKIHDEMRGTSAIGVISDSDPQPILVRTKHGTFAICMTGLINNAAELIEKYLTESGGHFEVMSSGSVNSAELMAALINLKSDFVEGIKFAQELVDGTASLLMLRDDGTIFAARDRFGRIPVLIGKNEDGYALAFESFAYRKLGYEHEKELGPGEIVAITPDSLRVLAAPGKKKRFCSFLWSYYGYPTSRYEGVNVEVMRIRNGENMAENDRKNGFTEHIDYVAGVPDSGTPHAIGYSNRSHLPFARAFIKYTPTWSRSFTTRAEKERSRVAKMKQIPVTEFIRGKDLLFVDDSIVRGTQLRETVEFLYDCGARSVHMRSACPPIMHGCKYLNFTRTIKDSDLLARRVIEELEGEEGLKHLDEYSDGTTERGKKLRCAICEKMHFASLDFQSLDGVLDAIGLPEDELCTYCWTGKE